MTERDSRSAVRTSIWFGDADGTHQRRIWRSPGSTTSPRARYGEPVPDYHGRHLLTSRTTGGNAIVDWPTEMKPSGAQPLDFMADAFGYAWN